MRDEFPITKGVRMAKTILIVDDETRIRQVVARYLARERKYTATPWRVERSGVARCPPLAAAPDPSPAATTTTSTASPIDLGTRMYALLLPQ